MVNIPCSVNSLVKLICPPILPALGNFIVTSVLPSRQRETQLNSLVQHPTEIDRTFAILATEYAASVLLAAQAHQCALKKRGPVPLLPHKRQTKR